MIDIVIRDKKDWRAKDLQRAARALGVEVNMIDDTDPFEPVSKTVDRMHDTVFWVLGNVSRTHRMAIFHEIIRRKKKLINGHRFRQPNIKTKCFQQKIVELEKDLDGIRTYAFRREEQLFNLLEDKGLDLPLIVKPDIGSAGKGIQRLSSMAELQDFLSGIERVESFVFQPFIENDGDYRVFVVNGEVIGIMRRVADQSKVLNNLTQGGTAHVVQDTKIRDVLSELGKRMTNLFQLDYAGVDFIFDENTGRFRFMEINTTPNWKGLSKIADRDIGNALVKFANAVDGEEEKLAYNF